MHVWVGQIYVEAGVSFPFSSSMQRALGGELSSLISDESAFVRKYGPQFSLVIRLSARAKRAETEVRGPAVYKRSKTVEYAVFLPFDVIMASEHWCSAALSSLLDAIQVVFAQAGVVAVGLNARRAALVESICSDASMFEESRKR